MILSPFFNEKTVETAALKSKGDEYVFPFVVFQTGTPASSLARTISRGNSTSWQGSQISILDLEGKRPTGI